MIFFRVFHPGMGDTLFLLPVFMLPAKKEKIVYVSKGYHMALFLYQKHINE